VLRTHGCAHRQRAECAWRGGYGRGEERRGEERRGDERRERERETQRMLEHGRLRKSNMTSRKTVDYIGIPGLRKQLRMSVTP
jgi:hypothetical protein